MTEAPEDHPDLPPDDEIAESDAGVEGRGDAATEEAEAAGPEDVRTGDPRVDEVLTSMDSLHELPVGEHAAVFEAAHEQLRAALEPDRDPA